MKITEEIINLVESMSKSEEFRQDVYVQLLEMPEPEDDDLKKYVSKVMKNMVGNRIWTQNNRRRLEEEHENEIAEWSGVVGVAPDPLDSLIAEELEGELIGDLSDIEKDVYGLVIAGDQDYTEAAKMLEISYDSLRKHVSRIKKKFNGNAHKDNNNNGKAKTI